MFVEYNTWHYLKVIIMAELMVTLLYEDVAGGKKWLFTIFTSTPPTHRADSLARRQSERSLKS